MTRLGFVAAAVALAACAPAPPAPAPPPGLAIPSIASSVAPSPPPAPDVPEYARPFLPNAGASDADVAAAAKEITRRAEAGEPVEPAASDALWRCFAAFRPSRAKSISLVTSLYDAVLAVKAPAYGPRAAALLEVPLRDPHDPAETIDQIQFLQNTAAQVLGRIGYAGGVRALVNVLLTPEKRDLQSPVRNALAQMPDASEPALIAALQSKDSPKDAIPRLADALAHIARPAGRDATLAALESADNDDNRTVLAITLPAYPSDPALVPAFERAYKKIAAGSHVALLGGGNARGALLGAAAGFHDPTLVPWILKEIAAAKGDAADEMIADGFQSATKLMTTASSAAVETAIAAKVRGPSIEKQMYKGAAAILSQCKQDPACYVTFLDTPLAASDIMARFGHVKAASMAALYGNTATRDALVKKLAGVDDGSIRLAIVDAIVHLTPRGDRASADALDAIVTADKQTGQVAGIDEIHAAAQRLRARAP